MSFEDGHYWIHPSQLEVGKAYYTKPVHNHPVWASFAKRRRLYGQADYGLRFKGIAFYLGMEAAAYKFLLGDKIGYWYDNTLPIVPADSLEKVEAFYVRRTKNRGV